MRILHWTEPRIPLFDTSYFASGLFPKQAAIGKSVRFLARLCGDSVMGKMFLKNSHSKIDNLFSFHLLFQAWPQENFTGVFGLHLFEIIAQNRPKSVEASIPGWSK